MTSRPRCQTAEVLGDTIPSNSTHLVAPIAEAASTSEVKLDRMERQQNRSSPFLQKIVLNVFAVAAVVIVDVIVDVIADVTVVDMIVGLLEYLKSKFFG